MFSFLSIQYVSLAEKFNPNISFLKILSINPIGVIIVKKTISITIGGTIFPRTSPNFIQRKLKGLSNSGFIKEKKNKKAETKSGVILIGLLFKIGQSEINKKTTENTNPNFFSGVLLISFNYTL